MTNQIYGVYQVLIALYASNFQTQTDWENSIFFFIIYYNEHQPSTILRENKRWEVIYVVEKASVTTKTNEDLPELTI